MKRSSTLYMRVMLFLIGVVVMAGLIRFPTTEGRAANLDLVSIYSDPFIIFIYIGSIPFFAALYQGIKLLDFIEKKKLTSNAAVHAIKNIKFCALTLIGFITAAVIYIFLTAKATNEDPVGFLSLGTLLIISASAITYVAAKLQKRLQKALRS